MDINDKIEVVKSLSSMSNREFVIALMRGDAKELKQGYSIGSAILAVKDLRRMTKPEELDLYQYAEGFLQGAKEDPSKLQLAE